MKMGSRWLMASALLLALASPVVAQNDWTTYGGNDQNQRFSQLKQITTKNVGQLVLRRMFQTGIEKLGSFENTPIVTGNVMYVTTPYNTAMAYDLTSGKELWRYTHKLGTTIYCCGPNNRGVGIHGGAHVYMGTLDARLVALDAKTGKVLWDKEVADPAFGYSITHAPLVLGDNVIVGSPPRRAIPPSMTRRPTAGSGPGRLLRPKARTSTATSPRRRPTAPSSPTPGSAAVVACG
jgi:glucose dehydrogenase